VDPILRLALAQLNLWVGDISGNTERIIDAARHAREQLHADVVLFPELALTSYPREDLLLRPGLHRRIRAAMEKLGQTVHGIALILGHPHSEGGKLFNACSLIREGRIEATYRKQQLPNYSVFDEKRYFSPGGEALVCDLAGIPTALTVCEDIWVPSTAVQARLAGARLLLNINASPYHMDKPLQREEVLRASVKEGGLPIVYLNLVGGQDELVFDGGSMVMNAQGQIVLRAPDFEEGIYRVEIESQGEKSVRVLQGERVAPILAEEGVYKALVLGVRDYVNKNRFRGAALGLSGGIDSALTLVIAVDALGKDRVEAVSMPSPYTSSMSIEDAREQAETLGVGYHSISIERPVESFNDCLAEVFSGLPPDVTEENIQARCRGVLLMAISNKKGLVVLATGNKSEMAVGYATLYGDMAGGFAPLKDLSKTWVYRLAHWRNRLSPVIPERVIERPPSAELKPGQKDTDSLPPYEILDPILESYIERDQTPREITAAGFDPAVVRQVVALVDRNEYKRRQAAPGVRITKRAFGRDRRYPITSGYQESQ